MRLGPWTGVAVVCAAAGCYRPAFEDACTVRCSAGVCPSGLLCGSDGLCHDPDRPICSEAVVDARPLIDAMPGCYGRDLVNNYCPGVTPTADYAPAPGTTMDTDVPCANPPADPYCLVISNNITIAGTFRATGSRPLVMIAATQLWIQRDGIIDVSTVGSAELGAGAATGTALCGSPTDGMGHIAAGVSGGGGAGGTYRGLGGRGGTTVMDENTAGAPALGGQSVALRGGCPGTAGGNSAGVPGAGLGGGGGGSVVLIAGGPIVIDGVVRAFGGGGAGGSMSMDGGGGGGGGSGGLIALDAPQVIVNTNARLLAGGGGGGSGGTNSGLGAPGQEMTAAGDSGAGGLASNGGGGGGPGGAAGIAEAGGAGIASTGNGGGGGGGGVGAIRIAGVLEVSGIPVIHPAHETP